MMSEDDIGAKEDVVLAVKNKLSVEKDKLYKLSIDDLDMIFGLIYMDLSISPSEIADIINNSPPEDIMANIEKRKSQVTVLPEYYDEKEDVRAAILANIHEEYVGPDLKNEITERLMRIDDVNKLLGMTQLSLQNLEIALGIRPPPQVTKPVSVPEEQESSVSTNFIHQTETGLETSPPFSSPTIPTSNSDSSIEEKPPPDVPANSLPNNIVARRQEEVKQKVAEIEKMITRAKIDLNDKKEDIEVLKRIHPNRLDRVIQIFKKEKKKDRIKLLFEWFVISQQIEEIEVLVTHWQGIQQGAGAFQAAIGMARFDNIMDNLSNKDIEEFIRRAQKAVSDVQTSPDINTRIVGVEDIKELASDLYRKAVPI